MWQACHGLRHMWPVALAGPIQWLTCGSQPQPQIDDMLTCGVGRRDRCACAPAAATNRAWRQPHCTDVTSRPAPTPRPAHHVSCAATRAPTGALRYHAHLVLAHRRLGTAGQQRRAVDVVRARDVDADDAVLPVCVWVAGMNGMRGTWLLRQQVRDTPQRARWMAVFTIDARSAR